MGKRQRKTFNKEDGISFTEFFAFNRTECKDINDMRDSDCCSKVLQNHKKSNPPEGWFRLYWENGNLKYEWYYKGGKQDGISKSWWPSGQIKNIQNYKNGSLHGLLQGWYENGSPRVLHDEQTSGIRSFDKGRKDGEWIDYYKSGQVWMKKTFNKGKLLSEKYWNRDGSVGNKSCHKEGERKQYRKINPNW